MSMIYIQQNGTLGKSIPYTNRTHPTSTIATSGCGCCSSLMVLLNSTKYSMTLKNWAKILMKKGAREYDGTDMTVVGKIMKNDYGFEYEHTTDIEKLKAHLKAGYKAVANIGEKGYFSSAGHYVCVAGITDDGKAIVLDPYYYAGKWTTYCKGINRAKYFKYDANTHELYCDFSTIAADARYGKYHLFKPTKKVKLLYSEKDNKSKAVAPNKPVSPAKPKGYTKWTGYVTADTLNIRKGASTNYDKLGTFSKGQAVCIEGEKNNFYQITYKGKVAYISKDYVSKKKPNSTTWTGTVTASSLRIREKASTSSKILGSYKKGTKVTIYGSSGDFYAIRYNGKVAYLAKQYIKK